jgi:hypothetical protein
MRAGYDARRRNRHIGTAAQGHGADNRLVVPRPRAAGFRSELRLGEYRVVHRQVAGRRRTFLVERTRADCWHACTIDDMCRILRHVPAADLDGLRLFVLRQPTRKQELLQPVWGRLWYWINIGADSGAGVVLEAVQTPSTFRLRHRLRPFAARERQRLLDDGHDVSTDRRGVTFRVTLHSARNTQLYRTLPHEIGHWVDYRRHSPERYWQRTSREREEAAHRYADAFCQRLAAASHIPFPRIADPVTIRADGLDPTDFRPPRRPDTAG